MLAAEHLGDVADHLIGHFVDQARRSGASWTDIGRSMGVTKQAARKRFVPKDPGDARPRPQRRLQPLHPAGPASGDGRARGRPDGRQRRGRARAPGARAAQRAATRSPSGRSRAPAPRPTRCATPPWRPSPPASDDAPALVPYADQAQEGPRAHVPRGAPPRAQLHRHRAPPARAARARGRRRSAARRRRRQGRASRRTSPTPSPTSPGDRGRVRPARWPARGSSARRRAPCPRARAARRGRSTTAWPSSSRSKTSGQTAQQRAWPSQRSASTVTRISRPRRGRSSPGRRA